MAVFVVDTNSLGGVAAIALVVVALVALSYNTTTKVQISHSCPRQVLVQVLVFAFLVVMGCTALMVPVLLYGFDLRHAGWRWQHAALFTAMIAGTDAVAVSAIIKGGPPPCCPLTIEQYKMKQADQRLCIISSPCNPRS